VESFATVLTNERIVHVDNIAGSVNKTEPFRIKIDTVSICAKVHFL